MLRKLFANIRDQWMGALALFLVLGGGTAYAVDGSLAGQNTVGSEDIINSEVTSNDIADSAVKKGEIASDAVGFSEIDPVAFNGEIKAGAFNFGIANNSVDSDEVIDGTLAAKDISAAAFNSEIQAADGAYGLANDSVQSREVSDGSLTGDDLASKSVGSFELGEILAVVEERRVNNDQAFPKATVDAECPSGTQILSGGGSAETGGFSGHELHDFESNLVGDYTGDGAAWRVSAVMDAEGVPGDNPLTVEATALCLTYPGLSAP